MAVPIEEYKKAKRNNPKMIVLFPVAEVYYEAYFEDAQLLAKLLDLALVSRDAYPMTFFYRYNLDNYLRIILDAGYKAAIYEAGTAITGVDYSQEVKDYASAIHRLTCQYNHTDGCAWFYGPLQREYYYKKVIKQLRQLRLIGTPQNIHELADILCPSTVKWRKDDE